MILKYLDGADQALPPDELDIEKNSAVEKDSALGQAGLGVSLVKMARRRHMWVQTEESTLQDVEELKKVVADLEDKLAAVSRRERRERRERRDALEGSMGLTSSPC